MGFSMVKLVSIFLILHLLIEITIARENRDVPLVQKKKFYRNKRKLEESKDNTSMEDEQIRILENKLLEADKNKPMDKEQNKPVEWDQYKLMEGDQNKPMEGDKKDQPMEGDQKKEEKEEPTEYQKLYKHIITANIKEDMDEYTNQCIIGIRSLCTEYGKECMSITEYAQFIFNYLHYDELKNDHAESFIGYIWDRVEQTGKIMNGAQYCKNYSKEKNERKFCEAVLIHYEFYSYIKIDTLMEVFYFWSQKKIDELEEGHKNIISGFHALHKKAYKIKDDSSLKGTNIPEEFCKKKRCLYELNGIFPDKFLKKKNTLANAWYRMRNIIKFTKFKYQYSMAKYYLAYFYNSIDINIKKLWDIPLFYCFQRYPFIGICGAVLDFTRKMLGIHNQDQILEKCYFEYASDSIALRFFYVESYMDHLADRCSIAKDRLENGYHPQEFCKSVELI